MAISQEDAALAEELGLDIEPEVAGAHSPLEERIMAGFEDIVRFRETHGRIPQHGEARDIFERLYAARLDQIRKLPEAMGLLSALDKYGLLAGGDSVELDFPDDDDALLALLGDDEGSTGGADIGELRHVRSTTAKRAAEEIAGRSVCHDFAKFKPIFATTQHELDAGIRTTQPFKDNISILEGQFFILQGQLTYVAEVADETRITSNRVENARLRVIFDNGTESNLWRDSLRRALSGDEKGRRLTGSSDGPLFDSNSDEGDVETGTIYVLRSKSDHPFIAEHRDVIHKIGVTGGSVESRIAGAENQSTYLLAGVDIVATYKLHNMNRAMAEKLFHKLFSHARLKIAIEDRFGKPVEPKEWFFVPLSAIDEAVTRLLDGSITNYIYDTSVASLRSIHD